MRARIAGVSTFALATALLPALASAQNIQSILSLFGNLLNAVIWILVTLAVVIFFWGLVKYIFNRDGGEKGGTEGATLMFWGIVAIFVMVSIWGIIRLLQNTFGVSSGQGALVPSTIPVQNVGGPGVINLFTPYSGTPTGVN